MPRLLLLSLWFPMLAGCRTPAAVPELQQIALIDTAGWAHDVALDGDTICVSDRQGGFVVLDRRDPGGRTPRVAAPVADVISLARGSSGFLLASRFEGLVSMSDSGQVLARLANGDIANAVEARGDLGFVAYGLHGLVIARVAKSGIQIVSQLPSPGWAHGLRLLGDRAYVADWNYGLRVVDVRNPEKPAEIGVLPTPATTIAVALHRSPGGKLMAAVAEGHAGVALAEFDGVGRPVLLGRNSLGLNAADPPHPETGGWAHGVAWSGIYVFVANWKRGLAIVDVSDVRNPRLILEHATTGTALSVAAEQQPDGSHLIYLADGEAGLRILRWR